MVIITSSTSASSLMTSPKSCMTWDSSKERPPKSDELSRPLLVQVQQGDLCPRHWDCYDDPLAGILILNQQKKQAPHICPTYLVKEGLGTFSIYNWKDDFFLYFVVDVIKSLFLQDKAHGGIYVCWEVKYMYPSGDVYISSRHRSVLKTFIFYSLRFKNWHFQDKEKVFLLEEILPCMNIFEYYEIVIIITIIILASHKTKTPLKHTFTLAKV